MYQVVIHTVVLNMFHVNVAIKGLIKQWILDASAFKIDNSVTVSSFEFGENPWEGYFTWISLTSKRIKEKQTEVV